MVTRQSDDGLDQMGGYLPNDIIPSNSESPWYNTETGPLAASVDRSGLLQYDSLSNPVVSLAATSAISNALGQFWDQVAPKISGGIESPLIYTASLSDGLGLVYAVYSETGGINTAAALADATNQLQYQTDAIASLAQKAYNQMTQNGYYACCMLGSDNNGWDGNLLVAITPVNSDFDFSGAVNSCLMALAYLESFLA